MRKRLFTMGALAASLMSVVTVANCQEHLNRLQTNLPGVTTAMAPPAGFDPLTVSDAELALYGFPPKPDETLQPNAHASWIRAMAAAKQRVFPKLEQTKIFHGPARMAMSSEGTSNNWSGFVDFSGATTFDYASSFHSVSADFVVPVAIQAYGTCTGSWDYSSTWVGIDGAGSNDALQAGTESDAYCGQGSTAAFYSAWFEWFPNGSVRISNFPVGPGDDLYVSVWNSSAVEGNAYIANYTTGLAINIEFPAPPGTALIGNSAEWVVERPSVNGGLANLTNYVSDYLSNCIAVTWGQVFYTPGHPSAVQVTMLDDQAHPISVPSMLGDYGIWFQDAGSARF